MQFFYLPQTGEYKKHFIENDIAFFCDKPLGVVKKKDLKVFDFIFTIYYKVLKFYIDDTFLVKTNNFLFVKIKTDQVEYPILPFVYNFQAIEDITFTLITKKGEVDLNSFVLLDFAYVNPQQVPINYPTIVDRERKTTEYQKKLVS